MAMGQDTGRYRLLHDLTVVTGDSECTGSISICGEYIDDVWLQDKDGNVVMDGMSIPYSSLPDCYLRLHPDAAISCFDRLAAFAGGIDAHVHFREPGMTSKADMSSESLAAVLGGVTSFIDMPNTTPPTISASRLKEKLSMAAGRCWANYGFHIGATNSNAPEIASLIEGKEIDGITSGDFGGIKVFMGSSTGNMLVDDSDALSAFFMMKGKEVLVHSEDEGLIRKNLAEAKEKYGDNVPFSAHKDIRSRQACIRSTVRALELALKYGTRLHVLHVSTKEEIEMIRQAKRYNPLITAETSAGYLWFSSEDYDRLGSHLKCNPAVKDPEDREALREALKDGSIDTIGSDHAPHLVSEKARGYLDAPSGLPSVRQTLPVLLTVARDRGIPLSRIASVFSEKASATFGMKDRGCIRKGYKADIVIADPHERHTVTQTDDGYRCGWTPYEGIVLNGTIKTVFVNGQETVKDSRLNCGSPSGQKLAFEKLQ